MRDIEKPSDPDQGIYRGQSVARVTRSPDGMVILIGRSSRDNDTLTFKLASPLDFWFHVAGHPGSHVIVRNPEGLAALPRDTRRMAAALAVGYSRLRNGGMTAVHETRVRHVSKPGTFEPGKVVLSRHTVIRSRPSRLDENES